MKFRVLIILCVCWLVVSTQASAHSGRTDENGGHTVSETGEYHYHHGYPAHDHYDIDGDGDLDCPYDFDDRTSSGSQDTSGSGTATKEQRPKRIPKIWAALLVALLAYASLIVLVFIVSSVKEFFKPKKRR